MINHDIFLRALAVESEQKQKSIPKPERTKDDGGGGKWPEHALVFDTETRITADQKLTVGVYRRCRLVGDSYTVTEEGVFYADDISVKERRALDAYKLTAVSDVPSFPPRFTVYSRSEFMKRVFWPAIKRDGAMVCGFALPFDLTRLALAWSRGRNGEWSLTMSQYRDGEENRNYPRISIQPIDSKKAFIKLVKPWKPEEWKKGATARFLDLRTLAWALFNQSFSLKTLCTELTTEHRKLDHKPTGKVTAEEIDYARQDVRCTVDALNALKKNFDQHPIGLSPFNAYSPASVAKSYLEQLGIAKLSEKFATSNDILGIAMQSYYGGRSETRVRRAEVPVVPVDFTSQYPSCCALLNLFDVVTAETLSFDNDTGGVHDLLNKITLEGCLKPEDWQHYKFFAFVKPHDDIFPVRTMYNGTTQNIGNNYLNSDKPLWFAGPDLIASIIRTGKVPEVIRAIRMVPHGKQGGMRSVNLRGMVEINPYLDDLFRKVIEQRKLHKFDPALYYWLKIFANSIYGFFVELNPETKSKNVDLNVFSGEASFVDRSDVVEKPGAWFFPPLASLITASGRLLLAMVEACVEKKKGTYLFCDTDSLAIVASKRGGRLRIPGSKGDRILSWAEAKGIAEKFTALNPYNREIVKGSILNLVDANFVDSDSSKPQRQLYGYSIAAKRYALYERTDRNNIQIVDPKAHGIGFLYPPIDSPTDWNGDAPKWIYELWDYIVRGALGLKRKTLSWRNLPQMMRLTITTCNVLTMLGNWAVARPYNFLFLPMVDSTFGYVFDKHANEKVLLVSEFSSDQEKWFENGCINVHTGKKYKMADCTRKTHSSYKVVYPSQFSRLLIEYEEHPEAKSLAPDGGPCMAETRGLLKRAHITAGVFRYVGKETDRKWEEHDDISVLQFRTTEFGRARTLIANASIVAAIRAIGIRQAIKLTNMSQHTIEKIIQGKAVKRKTLDHVIQAIHALQIEGDLLYDD